MATMPSIVTLLIGLTLAASTISGAAEHASVSYDQRNYRGSGGVTPIDCADVLAPAPGALANPTTDANDHATELGGACLALHEGATVIDVRINDVTARGVSFAYELVDADGASLTAGNACRYAPGIKIPADAVALVVRVDAAPREGCDAPGIAGYITMISHTPM